MKNIDIIDTQDIYQLGISFATTETREFKNIREKREGTHISHIPTF